MSDPRRTPDERAKARARNIAFNQAREDRLAELPLLTIDQLWRTAGGGTSKFSLRAFSALVDSEHWRAVDPCSAGGCGDLPSHLCWWSAIRASVLELRRRRPAAKSVQQEQGSLFDISEVGGTA